MTECEEASKPAKGAHPVHDLINTLEQHRGETHIIVLQDFPDPDAISTAYTHQVCCNRFDIEADIVYSGRISHQQNIALVRIVGIELLRCEPSLDVKKYQGAVFLDNQGDTASHLVKILSEAGTPSLIVVDHHEPHGELNPEFRDIRRNIGATASIYADYLQQDRI